MTIIISLAITLIAIEGAARAFVTFIKPNIMILDDSLGWTHRRSASRTYQVEGHAAHVETNELGLRGPIYRDASNKRRVLVLGDSFVDAFEVSNEELFTAILDGLRSDLEVVNAGVGGFGTVQQRLRLEELAPIVRPELVLLMVYPNDLTDNVMPFYGGIGPRPYLHDSFQERPITWDPFDPLLLPVPGKRWLHRHSIAAYLIRNRIWLPLREPVIGPYVVNYRNLVPIDTKWRALEYVLDQFSGDYELVIAALPKKASLIDQDREFTSQLESVATKNGLRFLPLDTVLEPYHFYEQDIHWNTLGHEAVANYLAEVL
ncbi:MAG: SGNH/GDSL hydrolase family protein [Gammaproteobacteria bacterium]|nr:SGNH/GDSL hydrolase family protein [Gammaproteobacteria bacterium]